MRRSGKDDKSYQSLLELFDRYHEQITKEIVAEEQKLLAAIKRLENINYSQIEAFYWLTRRLSVKSSLPPLRGWTMSPDILLKLHEYITTAMPRVVLEFGGGVSSVVVCDALRQNSYGRLVSIDHIRQYSDKTRQLIKKESLGNFVDLQICPLEVWQDKHMTDEQPVWYSKSFLENIQEIDLVIIDGPPGATCKYARYPAVPAVYDKLSENAQIWIDDAGREDEAFICEQWAQKYGFKLEFLPTEKGLGILSR
ncbi:MAG: class I SAM-dependent methyltransferase [Campylobacteraceae bacterium]|jgi:predicted O-methyltransferase YrrM|nr:class I SAM-dependent methyltransferase [Campylobacteraceae bacterium]